MTPQSPQSSFWDERYASVPNGFGDKPNAFLASVAGQLPPGGVVYVPGDGYGRNGLWLARRGHPVVIVDASSVGIEQARTIAEKESLPVTAVVADLRDYTPGPCDAAVFIYVHLPPEERHRMHRRAWNALRPGGVLVVEAFHPNQRALGRTSGGPRDPQMLVTAEDLVADFPGAEIVTLNELTVELKEGPFHSGMGDIVRLLAVKPQSSDT